MTKISLTCTPTKQKRVFFQGSFDLFHYGHLHALERARQVADHVDGILIVGINTDELYKDYKDREPIVPYEWRKKIIERLSIVDKVIPADKFSPLEILKRERINIYVICEEWKNSKEKEIEYMKSKDGETVVVPYFKGISASELRTNIAKTYVLHDLLESIPLCPKCRKLI